MRRAISAVLLGLFGLVVIDVIANRGHAAWDLTADDSLSLTEQTRTIATQVRQRTTITAFLQPDDPERALAAPLLLRYTRLNRRIRFRIVDPQRAGGELRRLGVDLAIGGVAVQQGNRVERASTLTEQDITGALLRLGRTTRPVVCVTQGHGEAEVAATGPDGLSNAVRLLERNGFVPRPIDLVVASQVPSGCDALVLPSPTADLGSAAEGIAAFLADDGKALVLSDPISAVDLDPILQPYGLGIRRGIVLEGDPSFARPGDPSTPIVRTYSAAHPVARRLPPTLLSLVQQVEVEEERADRAGLTVSRLADTSPASYLETEPLDAEFSPQADAQGPITVVAAADLSRLGADGARRTRLVVTGDVDFATNAAIGEGGNSTLLLQALGWLTLDEDALVLSANLPRDRRFVLTSARLGYARFVGIGLLPGLFLLSGAFVWVFRRGR